MMSSPPDQDSRSARLPDRIGPYRVLEELGRGGMGVVYRAEQREPMRRTVALKVVQAGMATSDVLARFEFERRALAAMNHRFVAKVFDAGATERGEPYFVMELIEGPPVTDYCDTHRLSLPDRLRLFQKVCQGVQHAHQKGVIHRDLKPGNVLVVREGDEAVPKIVDFGLAKAVNRDFLEVTQLTEKDRVVGTPEYMSPEQAAADGRVIDTRADIYSLGVMLYELLCGTLPFTSQQLKQVGQLEAMRVIREVEPPKPSTRVGTATEFAAERASQCRTSVAALHRALMGDLDWVVMRAIEKEPERRYESATGLAMELDRYLEGVPVLAGPPSVGYRLRKFLRRNRGLVAATLAVVISLSLGLVVALRLWSSAEESRATSARLLVLSDTEIARRRLVELADWVDGRLWPVLPISVPAMEQWLADVATVRLAIGEKRTALDELRRGLDVDTVAKVEAAYAQLAEGERDFGSQGVEQVVRRRIAQARSVGTISLEDAAAAWELAIARIEHSPIYDGLHLRPQVGLVPLGPDPFTRLEEFAHVGSGSLARRDVATGNLADNRGGIVFVLLAGHTVRLGATRAETVGPHADPSAIAVERDGQRLEREGPVADCAFDAFFVAKFECTQAQWMSLTGDANPSHYHPDLPGVFVRLVHPVESVTWTEAATVLAHHGLQLPTEAQWEYAARAGTDSPWWTGADRKSLLDNEGAWINIADRSARDVGFPFASSDEWPQYDDRSPVHAPVGSFPANDLGIHEILGNVYEWCRDEWVEFPPGYRPGDGLRLGRAQPGEYPVRGGSFHKSVSDARCTARKSLRHNAAYDDVGFRAARQVDR